MDFIKNPQTTIALTFLTHIISGIDGVTRFKVKQTGDYICTKNSKTVSLIPDSDRERSGGRSSAPLFVSRYAGQHLPSIAGILITFQYLL